MEKIDTEYFRGILANLGFLEDLSEKDLDKLVNSMKKVFLQKGQTMIKEGEHGDSFYFIQSGRVEVWMKGKLLSCLGTGEFFGEMSLLSGEKRNATITAKETCEFFVLDERSFKNVLSSNPKIKNVIENIQKFRHSQIEQEKNKLK